MTEKAAHTNVGSTKRMLGKSSRKAEQAYSSSSDTQAIKCPECTSQKAWHDGIRHTNHGDVQRYLCRNCGYRFSHPDSTRKREWNLNSRTTIVSKRQVCDLLTEESKNLAEVIPKEVAQREGIMPSADAKGKIVEFAWHLKKENYSEETIRTYSSALRILIEAKVNIADQSSVKEALMKYGEARKHVFIAVYTLFLKMQGLTWNPPRCQVTRPLPFIPTERELDDLIAGCGRKLSAFLQMLKETAMRVGEAVRLKWKDLDLERKTITLNQTEKHGNPRIFTISNKLCDMLSALPKNSEYVFGTSDKRAKSSNFYVRRRMLAHKLGNPRLLEIGFHTFRHWKATALYHETKDIVLVKQFLGHRNIENTMLYIQLENAIFKSQDDKFIVKATGDHKEIAALLEVGFEYVCQKNDLVYFRKRK